MSVRRWAAVVAVLAGLTHGCVVDRVPPPDAYDRIWEEWMLAGHYAQWAAGGEVPWEIIGEDRLASAPEGTLLTRYAINVRSPSGFLQGGWWIHGGLIGRAEAPGAWIELFAKVKVRIHWPGETAKYGRDDSQDYFLAVRPKATGRGRVIKAWHFPPASLMLVVDPRVEAEFRQRYSENKDKAQQLIDQNKHHNVHGQLYFDPTTKMATVTITGVTTPVEERVDLTRELSLH